MAEKPSGSPELPHAEITVIPSFHDADPMGVVWHGNYLRFFEKAREELFRKMDYGYRTMRDTGFIWPVIDLRVRYRKPLLVEEPVTVSAQITEYENRLVVSYTVRNAQGKTLCTAYTAHMAYDTKEKAGCLASPRILYEKLGIAYPD